MKPKCLILAAGLITGALSCSAFGQQDEKLGKLSFPTSCDPKVQAEFERGVAMLHSYWFLYARKTFEGVLQQDPACAMAYWGVAMDLLGNTLVGPPSRADAQAAWEALEKARAIGAKTQRERDWIEALSAYYRDHDKVAGRRPVARLQRRHGADDAALSRRLRGPGVLRADAPGVRVEGRHDLRQPAEICGDPGEALRAEPAASRACRISSFMPTTMRRSPTRDSRPRGATPASRRPSRTPGTCRRTSTRWSDCGRNSIASNASALEIQPDYYHASDFTVYAHLQLAQDAKASAMIEKSLATADRGDRPITFVNFTARAAMPARYVLERADWAGAAALPMTPSQYPKADSLTRFARGLGMARSGDLANAKREIEAIKALRAALEKANQSYWADRSRRTDSRGFGLGRFRRKARAIRRSH